MKSELKKVIPKQIKGGFHNTESQKEFDTNEAAIQNFEILKQRFFSVHNWKSFCGEGFADFKLHDSSGHYVERNPQQNDYIRIDIPGPGNFEAKGFEWVKIIEIIDYQNLEDQFEYILIICKPTKSPDNKKNNHTAHFYSSSATSNFTIIRDGNRIETGIYGRNETPNFNAVLLDKLRNLGIALGGIIGFSKIQWKKLADGLLDFK